MLILKSVDSSDLSCLEIFQIRGFVEKSILRMVFRCFSLITFGSLEWVKDINLLWAWSKIFFGGIVRTYSKVLELPNFFSNNQNLV